ncbi:MAG: hypothetical protein IT458_15950 [Planctomycetes bacterium]|nr:hypothetical protein [Planctomycetota bacterium]
MAIGKKLLLHSPHDPLARSLESATRDWGCIPTVCASLAELRGRLEGGAFDLVLVEDSKSLRSLVGDPGVEPDALSLSLEELAKRHILRVLASTSGNKTRAAKILGIDTKTLYNKLKNYENEAAARRNGEASIPR